MRVIPALFCALMMFAGILLGRLNDRVTILFADGPFGVSPAMAAPPEEKLPELSKPQLHREKTKLEKAVDQAAAMLLQGKLPASEDGVRFALWLYGEKGDVAYLDVATKMARELVKRDPIMGSAALFWVAQAGGATLAEAQQVKYGDAGDHRSSLRKLAMVAATRDSTLKELKDFYSGIQIKELQAVGSGHASGFALGLLPWLRVQCEAIQFLGEVSLQRSLKMYGEIILGDISSQAETIGAQRALVVWEAGLLSGNSHLRDEAQEMFLEDFLETTLEDPKTAASVGLAAGRMSRHHVQLAIIGDPKDPTITKLRQAAYFLFEPNKIILNLDPKTDSKRMAELMYPPDAAPAMFVCVETLCSPPIKDPAELEKQVAEIKKLAAEVQQ